MQSNDIARIAVEIKEKIHSELAITDKDTYCPESQFIAASSWSLELKKY